MPCWSIESMYIGADEIRVVATIMPDNIASIRRKSPNKRLKTKLNEFNDAKSEIFPLLDR